MPETSAPARALDRNDPLPLWAQLLADLQHRFHTGEFADSFPTDTQLMAQYSVSRPTVREAIRSLTQRGVVIRERGQLSVVAPNGTSRYATAERLLAGAESDGRTRHSDVLSTKSDRDAAVAAELGLATTTVFQRVVQIHYADGHPIAHDTIWVTRTATGKPSQHNPSPDVETMIGRALASVDATTETINTERTDPSLAAVLDLDPQRDVAVVLVARWTAFADGRPIALRVTRIPVERFSLSTTWRADRAGTVVIEAEPITGTTPTELAAAAIRAHRHWRSNLAASLVAGDPIDIDQVASDTNCELGRWLIAPPPQVAGFSELASAREHHRAFHRAAADAVQVSLDGDTERSVRMLMKGSVAKHSSALTATLKLLAEPVTTTPDRQ